MAKDNKIKLARMSTACGPFLNEDIGMLNKEKIKTEGFIDLIDGKKCEIRYGRSHYRKKILPSSLADFLLVFCFFINDVINT
ncbi:hypothetical protein [Xenorhabdus sp. PB62.4]|uniref:hypothetical protein n=1 Tax=Xenorhabdus sp. PB62.4 TaxID=1851573 RepID=UPI001656E79B|nr:hypothetical protein [Xenorhabdus sp. PB62.4]MBC8951849.1 hypothetical protein [Xenorhabdus sp. PB62.4]